MNKFHSFPDSVLNTVRTPALNPVVLQAEKTPLEIDLRRLAVVVVDMQNAFVSDGGMFHLWGVNVAAGQKAVAPIKKITEKARSLGIPVIYIAHQYEPGLYESGGPNSPNWYGRSWDTYREKPELRDKLLIKGSWGADIVNELKPHPEDIFVRKLRYSAFFATNLDMILKTLGIKYLAFTGVATNICVEASIRDAFHLEYFPILVEDGAGNMGPPATQEATIFNVKVCFGWVTNSGNLIKAMDSGKK